MTKEQVTPPQFLPEHYEDDIFYLRSLQRRDNLIIKGIPTAPGETEQSLRETVKRIGTVCGVTVTNQEIVAVHRLNKRKNSDRLQNHVDKNKNNRDIVLVKFKERSDTKQKIFINYLSLIG